MLRTDCGTVLDKATMRERLSPEALRTWHTRALGNVYERTPFDTLVVHLMTSPTPDVHPMSSANGTFEAFEDGIGRVQLVSGSMQSKVLHSFIFDSEGMSWLDRPFTSRLQLDYIRVVVVSTHMS